MNLPRRQFLHLAAGAAALPAMSRVAMAQAYPSRPITMIVPFAPGGRPDGYTLVVGIWNTHVANAAIYALQYDVVKDFEPVLLLADAPLLLVASKAVPANDLKEFIAWLKLNPDKSSMGTVGAGSPGHLLGLLLQKETGTRFGLVAYRGAGPMQDVVAGQIETTFANTATSLPHVRAGSAKAFAVTAKKRLAIAPDIPSVDEAGLPVLHFSL